MAKQMFHIGEVVETKKAYKTNQQDEYGNPLYNGSIQIRVNQHTNFLGQIRTIWAAPATFNIRIPLVGEQVFIFTAPSAQESSPDMKDAHWFYMSPYNATDSMTLHNFHNNWERSKHAEGSKQTVETLNDIKEVGYTINTNPINNKHLQPFEGDDLWQGRHGQSIRFSRHVESVNKEGVGVYQKQPTWVGKRLNDPLLIINLKRPESGEDYAVEDLKDDPASIYMALRHKLYKLQPGFKKDSDVASTPTYDKSPQLLINSNRVVINARTDKAFLIGSTAAVVTARKVRFVTQKYKVDVDDLMDWLKDFIKEMSSTHKGSAPFAAAMGPTGPARNAAKVAMLKSRFGQKFK